MRFVLFYHSLISDWNHGNAHFLRGVVCELQERGHDVTVFEPARGWSLQNLLSEHGTAPIDDFHLAYPTLLSRFYDTAHFDLEPVLEAADVVIVHEWTDPALVARIGRQRAAGGAFRLLFHDTHHRAVSDPRALEAFELDHYDGVLAFGEVLREIYEDRAWAARAWTWHEAADTRHFRPPRMALDTPLDLVWIGNWGEGERSEQLHEFLIEPARDLGLLTQVYGVRYPTSARETLATAGIELGGWLPNFRVPPVFATAKATVHVPRRFYSESLPGIPTIRVFEALACGIPLVCAPWDDCEALFRGGRDYLIARHGKEMREHLKLLKEDAGARAELAASGWATIESRHTCRHRVDELLGICTGLGVTHPAPRPAQAGLLSRSA